MKNAIDKIKNRTYGTELELEGITRRKAAEAIQSVVGGTVEYTGDGYDAWTVTAPDGRRWKAMRDGSLTEPHAEVVTPVLKLADLETLQEVVRALRHAGARATAHCGAHVHVGPPTSTPASSRIWSRSSTARSASSTRPSGSSRAASPATRG